MSEKMAIELKIARMKLKEDIKLRKQQSIKERQERSNKRDQISYKCLNLMTCNLFMRNYAQNDNKMQ
jgi:hypothetical protein